MERRKSGGTSRLHAVPLSPLPKRAFSVALIKETCGPEAVEHLPTMNALFLNERNVIELMSHMFCCKFQFA